MSKTEAAMKIDWTSTGLRRGLPLVLVRGFGGMSVEDEKRIAYQGFNDGTVYHQKRGENYIYEGLVLRLLKSDWSYQDATNVIGYYANKATDLPPIPDELKDFPTEFFQGDKIVLDPAMVLHLKRTARDPLHTIWVFRYYDLGDRKFTEYARVLKRLIDFIRELAVFSGEPSKPKVNIIAHSMGGLIVREAIQRVYAKGEAEQHINKIVTLGTPHRGIAFQVLGSWLGSALSAGDELERFNPKVQSNKRDPRSYLNFGKHFPVERLLTVVGTNYKSYRVRESAALGRLVSLGDEFGANYNRSDGLVEQTSAQIPGAPRTFVHKCHGGPDSLVTSREAFEIATRFFFGDVKVHLRFVKGQITRGQDWFGKSEFFFGVSIKPRRVDFDLFHQSPEAENCYGPFHSANSMTQMSRSAGPTIRPSSGKAGSTPRRFCPTRAVASATWRCVWISMSASATCSASASPTTSSSANSTMCERCLSPSLGCSCIPARSSWCSTTSQQRRSACGR